MRRTVNEAYLKITFSDGHEVMASETIYNITIQQHDRGPEGRSRFVRLLLNLALLIANIA